MNNLLCVSEVAIGIALESKQEREKVCHLCQCVSVPNTYRRLFFFFFSGWLEPMFEMYYGGPKWPRC